MSLQDIEELTANLSVYKEQLQQVSAINATCDVDVVIYRIWFEVAQGFSLGVFLVVVLNLA